MFTAQKIKLFFSDPKFKQCNVWSIDSQDEAVNQIFAGQKQLRRSKVVLSTIKSKEGAKTFNRVDIMTDFLQSRLQALENHMIDNIEKTFLQKERIKDKYSEAEYLYERADKKLKKLMTNVEGKEVSMQDLEEFEAEVQEIRTLYQENVFLKNMNEEMKKRIEKKQVQINKK